MILPISKFFSPKMKLFVDGRKQVFEQIQKEISSQDQTIWLHTASLGEYEQAVPILEKLKELYPEHKILLSFFSPSGYEVKKNNSLADATVYLPLDTRSNAKKFIELSHPDLALFVKYEVWPNYLNTLNEKNIPALLISGNFRTNQIYFKSQGNFMKEALHKFDHLFVQNKSSEALLKTNGFEDVSISGDTRFDRVYAQLQMNNHLDFVEKFKQNNLCTVCGSTWPEDEKNILGFINSSPENIKFIIAPHEINEKNIESLITSIKKTAIRYSEIEGKNLKDYSVLIIDTIGLLTKIYSYADIAYVGGAAGHTGLHNILEPATFGVPVVIGKNHQNFPEASELKSAGGLFSVKDSEECQKILEKLSLNPLYRNEIGNNSKEYILENRGATALIINHIEELLKRK